MSNSNWYDNEQWYAPYGESVQQPEKKKKRRGMTPARVGGLICLVLVLIAASSLAFAAGRKDLPVQNNPQLDSFGWGAEFPGSAEEFFADYYESVTTDVVQSALPQANLPIDYTVEFVPAGEEKLSLPELYQKCAPTITAIIGYVGDSGYTWGTGVVISEDGLIVTNAHVIDSCDRIEITCYDDTVYEAKIVGADSISDLAVLKIDAKGLVAAEFGDSTQLQVGDPVAAIGNPLGETFRMTLTDGIISAIERGMSYNGHSMTLLQTNTALNQGNSGGALFNMYGQIVGITNMKMMSNYKSIEGIGFAIPSSVVKNVVDSLVVHGGVQGRPSIGITVGPIPASAAEEYGLPEGLYISDVSKGSDAEKKGIKVGDVLMEVNGEKVTSTADVNAIKKHFGIGDTLEFLIWRNGEAIVFEIELMDTIEVYK